MKFSLAAELERPTKEVDSGLSFSFQLSHFGCDGRVGTGSYQNQQADKNFTLDLRRNHMREVPKASVQGVAEG